MTRGVIRTSSSVRSLLRDVEPNSRPSQGMRLSSGTPLSETLSFCWIRPPSSTVWPLCTATWVWMVRCEMALLPVGPAVAPGLLTS